MTALEMLHRAASKHGVTPDALKGFVVGITLMSYGQPTDEQVQECLDLLLLNTDDLLGILMPKAGE